MANAEMKIFEAEKLHQPMIAAVSIIPIMPLQRTRRKQEVSFDYFNGYLKESNVYTVFKMYSSPYQYDKTLSGSFILWSTDLI